MVLCHQLWNKWTTIKHKARKYPKQHRFQLKQAASTSKCMLSKCKLEPPQQTSIPSTATSPSILLPACGNVAAVLAQNTVLTQMLPSSKLTKKDRQQHKQWWSSFHALRLSVVSVLFSWDLGQREWRLKCPGLSCSPLNTCHLSFEQIVVWVAIETALCVIRKYNYIYIC